MPRNTNLKVVAKSDFALVARHSDITIEKLVIGAFVLMGRIAVKRYVGVIQEKWFTDSVYKRICRVCLEMYEEGLEIEIAILKDRLHKLPNWDQIAEGDERLELTCDEGLQLTNIDNYVFLLGEAYRSRRLQDVIMDGWKDVNQPVTRVVGASNTTKIASNLIATIRKIGNEGVIRDGSYIGETAAEMEIERERVAALQLYYTGILSGVEDLDEMTLGWQNGDEIIIASRPSMGKTSLMLDCSLAAQKQKPKLHVHVESWEMSKEQLINRYISKLTKINLAKLRAPAYLSVNERQKIRNANEEFLSKNIHISDSRVSSNVDEMINSWYRLADTGELSLILVDYLQLIASTELHKYNGNDSMRMATMQANRKMMRAAKDINVPLIMLCTTSREADKRIDHRPMMSDLSECGAIEFDADIILFPYREAKYDKDLSDTTIELIIEKQRNGPTGTVYAGWEPTLATIYNLNNRSRPEQKMLSDEITKSLKNSVKGN